MTNLSDLVGRSATRRVEISGELVQRFADVVGDHNPLHLDAEAAGRSRFGGTIAHGMLVGSLFSGLIAHELPGSGSVYLSQSMTFRRPVMVGQTVIATVTCTSADLERSRVVLATEVSAEDGTVVLDGEALVLLDA